MYILIIIIIIINIIITIIYIYIYTYFTHSYQLVGFATTHGIISALEAALPPAPVPQVPQVGSHFRVPMGAGGLKFGQWEPRTTAKKARSNRRVRFLSQFLWMPCYIYIYVCVYMYVYICLCMYMYTLNRQRHQLNQRSDESQFLQVQWPTNLNFLDFLLALTSLLFTFSSRNQPFQQITAACRQVPQVPGFPAATPGSRQEQQAQMRLQHEQQPLADCGCGEYYQRGWIRYTVYPSLGLCKHEAPNGCLLGRFILILVGLPRHFC